VGDVFDDEHLKEYDYVHARTRHNISWYRLRYCKRISSLISHFYKIESYTTMVREFKNGKSDTIGDDVLHLGCTFRRRDVDVISWLGWLPKVAEVLAICIFIIYFCYSWPRVLNKITWIWIFLCQRVRQKLLEFHENKIMLLLSWCSFMNNNNRLT
jgi:hypothetical protein